MAKNYVSVKELEEAMKFVTEDTTCPLHIAATIDQTIALLPDANVEEVKHGKWIIDNTRRDCVDDRFYRLYITCSECGKTHYLGTTRYKNEYDSEEKLKSLSTFADHSFCGRCGAAMGNSAGERS